jgi:hypothetical protein
VAEVLTATPPYFARKLNIYNFRSEVRMSLLVLQPQMDILFQPQMPAEYGECVE